MVTPNQIELLPEKFSKLCGGYDLQLRKKAAINCVGETELACYNRFVYDLKRIGDKNFPYIFNDKEVRRVIKFTRLLVKFDTKGNRVPLRLYPFQLFIVVQLFGWVHKETGLLRFREAYISVARRNGKSALSSVLLHYFMTFSTFRSERAITFSIKKDSAAIVFRQFLEYCKADPDLDALYQYSPSAGTATSLGTDNYLSVFSGEADMDGYQSGFAIGDEVALQDGQLYTLVSDGQANMAQCLLIGITTAGFKINGWCHRKYQEIRQKLYAGKMSDSMFTFICEPDDDDDLADVHTWAKSNPLLFFTSEADLIQSKIDQYAEKFQRALITGGKDIVSFYTKQANKWMGQQDGKLCDFNILRQHCYYDFSFQDVLAQYKEWYLGIDLAQTNDLNSIAFCTWIWIDSFRNLLPPGDDEHGWRRLYFNVINFIPEKTLARHISSDHFNYARYVDKELFLTVGGGGERTAHNEICDKLQEIKDNNDLVYRTIAVDPYGCAPIQPRLEAMCDWYIVQRQTRKDLSTYVELIGTMVCDRTIAISAGSSDIFTRAIENTVVQKGDDGLVKMAKPSSASSNYRIDPCDAMVDAMIAPLKDYQKEQAKPVVSYSDWFKELYGNNNDEGE